MKEDKYAIIYCYSCHREGVAERGGKFCVCPFCGDSHPSVNVEKYDVSDAAGELLAIADSKYRNGEYASALDSYKTAIDLEENEPYAHLGAALAEFEVRFDDRGAPISRKKGSNKFEDNAHFKRALELLKDSMRGDRYIDFGAEIDGLGSGLDARALEKNGFEYIGTRLDSYDGDAKSVVIPNGTTQINALAFYFANDMQSIHIPASVAVVEKQAFMPPVAEITVDPANKHYEVRGGCLIEKRTGKLVFACRDACIPSDGSVAVIGSKAFDMNKQLVRLDIPEGVTTIERGAFDCCTKMTHISIPSTVTKIEMSAFVNCYMLKDVTVAANNPEYYVETGCLIERKSGTLIFGAVGCKIPSTVKAIGTSAFGGDHKALSFPASVERGIEDGFCGCEKIESLTVDPSNETYYSSGDCIIEKQSGTLVLGCARSVIPDDGSVRKIGEHAFAGNKGLKKIVIPSGVTDICKFAFECCSNLREIVLPNTLELIDSYAFEMCYALTEFRVPDGVKELGVFVFDGCKNLESLYIPSSVAVIHECITSGCEKLATVVFEDRNGWTMNDEPLDPEELENNWAIDLLDSWNKLIKLESTESKIEEK